MRPPWLWLLKMAGLLLAIAVVLLVYGALRFLP